MMNTQSGIRARFADTNRKRTFLSRTSRVAWKSKSRHVA